MKKYLLYFLLITGVIMHVSLPSQAQYLWYNNGSSVWVQPNCNIYIDGSVLNDSVGTFKGVFHNSGTIYVSGAALDNKVSNGAFDSTGTVILSGDTQSIGGTHQTDFYKLKASGTSGNITLNKTITVSSDLTFQTASKYIASSLTNLLVIKDNATVTGADTTRFVSGPIKKIGNDTFSFPTGKGSNFKPLSMSPPHNVTDAYTAEFFNSPQDYSRATDTTVRALSTCEYWVLNRNAGASKLKVTLSWNRHSCNITSNYSLMRVAGYDASPRIWRSRGGTNPTGSSIAGTITSDSLNIFGALSLTSTTAVPGATAHNPIFIPSHDSISNVTLVGHVEWFSFRADSIRDIIQIDNQHGSTDSLIDFISVYDGTYPNLILIGSTTKVSQTDSVLILDVRPLIPNNHYLIVVGRKLPGPSIRFNIHIIGYTSPTLACTNCIGSFRPDTNKIYILNAWVKEASAAPTKTSYTYPQIIVSFPSLGTGTYTFTPSGAIIDGWQRVEGQFKVPVTTTDMNISLNCTSGNCLFDDIRVFPYDGTMKSYVYDPVTLRLVAELDERNYATIYEYDEEGKLTRVKKETEKGVTTIKESKTSSKKK